MRRYTLRPSRPFSVMRTSPPPPSPPPQSTPTPSNSSRACSTDFQITPEHTPYTQFTELHTMHKSHDQESTCSRSCNPLSTSLAGLISRLTNAWSGPSVEGFSLLLRFFYAFIGAVTFFAAFYAYHLLPLARSLLFDSHTQSHRPCHRCNRLDPRFLVVRLDRRLC